jgi:hypothetical protein
MIITRSMSAAITPSPADFQSLAVPAAKTIVTASTASTAQAINTERKSAIEVPVIVNYSS